MSKKTVRVMVAIVAAGVTFNPNDLVIATEEELKPFMDAKKVSDDEAGIKWCEEQGIKPKPLFEEKAAKDDSPSTEKSEKKSSQAKTNT